ncbi:SurA N-terminal domain-containing protein [Seleniivibrio woodruffii]|uniref:SurA N-terminal domain-containing protein n=1 Tax=Seleniivibrio woodruffii TaxID=1078050 RepID=UPI0039E59613
MISKFRQQKKLTVFALWFVIAAFIGTIFFAWGIGDQIAQSNFAIKVNETVITDADYSQKLDATRENFRSLFGAQADELTKDNILEKTVVNELIAQALLIEEAKRLNIPVSDAEVQMAIQNMQSFQTDGQFNIEQYTEILARNRMTPAVFEQKVKDDITSQKMTEVIKGSVAVTPKEIENEYKYRSSTAVINFIAFNADSYLTNVTDDAVLKKYYDEHKEEYRVPEKANFIALVFDPSVVQNMDIPVSDKEVDDYFQRNKATLTQPESVKASHILFRVEDWTNKADVDAKQKLAADVLAQIKAGADFAEMAKKYSADSSGQQGGDLGYFSKGQMVPEFETEAFRLKNGEVSNIVKTDFGFHIIKTIDHKIEASPSKEQAKAQIIDLIKKEKGQAAFKSFVFDKYKEIVSESNITAYNKKNGGKLPVAKLEGVTETGEGSPLAGKPDLAKRIMAMTKTEISQILDFDDKKVIFEMTDKFPSYIPKYEQIKNRVAMEYNAEQSVKAAEKAALEAAKSKTIEEASAKAGKSFTTTKAFNRNEPIEGLGMNNDLMDAVFASKPGSFLAKPYTVGANVYLVQVVSIAPPAAPVSATLKEQISTSLLSVKQDEAVNDYIAALKKKAKIEVNPALQQFYVK